MEVKNNTYRIISRSPNGLTRLSVPTTPTHDAKGEDTMSEKIIMNLPSALTAILLMKAEALSGLSDKAYLC